MFIAELENQKTGANECECEDCGEAMKLFHDPTSTENKIRKELLEKESFSSFLITEEGIPYGIGYGWVTTPLELWEEKFSVFFEDSSMSYEIFLDGIQRDWGQKFKDDSKISYIAEVGETLPARGTWNGPLFTGTFFLSVSEEIRNMPTFLTTQIGLRAHILLRAAGCREACRVSDNKRVVLGVPMGEVGREFCLSAREFNRKHMKTMRSILRADKEKL